MTSKKALEETIIELKNSLNTERRRASRAEREGHIALIETLRIYAPDTAYQYLHDESPLFASIEYTYAEAGAKFTADLLKYVNDVKEEEFDMERGKRMFPDAGLTS